VTWGPKEERLLITGVHTVADIYCTSCNTVLGWKYVGALGCGHEVVCCQCAKLSIASSASSIAAFARVQEHAVEEREKYKEGKSIVEKAKVMKVCLFSGIMAGVLRGQQLRAARGVHKAAQMLRC
jgi:hypothetical protein